jgi:hypothetical protein
MLLDYLEVGKHDGTAPRFVLAVWELLKSVLPVQ